AHGGRRHDRGGFGGAGRVGAAVGARRRAGRRAGGRRADLRAVRPRRARAGRGRRHRLRDGGRRGARAGDRRVHRACARRDRACGEPAGRRRAIRPDAAAAPGARRMGGRRRRRGGRHAQPAYPGLGGVRAAAGGGRDRAFRSDGDVRSGGDVRCGGGGPVNRILIAEDERRITSFLEKGLHKNGFTTRVVTDGLSAYEQARSGEFDLVILDLGLPVQDGFTVLRRLRGERVTIPMIILTARDSVADTVAGLEGGTDDYLAKPFAFEELLARIRLRLRSERIQEPTVLRAGDLDLDLRTRRARVGGRTVELTAREFALAEVFCRHPDQVLTREQLLSQVWGFDFDPGSNIVDVYIRYLRRKLGSARIETVRRVGY